MSTEESQAPPIIRVPPYNGFGRDDDLYAMALSLEPAMQENKQDEYNQFMQKDKKVLRFQVKNSNLTLIFNDVYMFKISLSD